MACRFKECNLFVGMRPAHLWLVGENGVLVRGQGTNWIVQSPSGGLVQTHVTCVAADTNGSVWIGTWGGGLYQWAGGHFKDLGLQASLHQKSPL